MFQRFNFTFYVELNLRETSGGVAQVVERSLSMREVPGSIPGISIYILHPFAKKFNSKVFLPGGESNPGLPRDRRGYLPLYYREKR